MIRIYEGNLFDSNADIICHQVNCQGVMGSGIAAEVKKRYPNVYASYRKDYEDGKLTLGYVNFTKATPSQTIANMCGQDKYGYDGSQYTHYEELQECLYAVREYAYANYPDLPVIAFPWNMSCHRGGGNWEVVYKMIADTFQHDNVEIWRLDNG